MPQWRKLHAKIVDSLDFNAMPDDFTRLLWTLLPLGVDREGRGIDDSSWVRSRLMPLRRDVALEAVQSGMDWFCEHGMIVRYQVQGGCYFFIPTFAGYQGKTDREAPSKLPPPQVMSNSGPTHDQVMTNSGVSHELLLKRSSTDSDSDSDVDADSNTHPVPLPPAAPAPLVGGGAPKSTLSMRETLDTLERYFSELTGLPILPARTSGQKEDAAARSWAPLTEIYKQCGGDLDATKRLLAGAVGHMRAHHLTIGAPKSVLSVAIRLHAESKGPQRNRDDPDAAARMVALVQSEKARIARETPTHRR